MRNDTPPFVPFAHPRLARALSAALVLVVFSLCLAGCGAPPVSVSTAPSPPAPAASSLAQSAASSSMEAPNPYAGWATPLGSNDIVFGLFGGIGSTLLSAQRASHDEETVFLRFVAYDDTTFTETASTATVPFSKDAFSLFYLRGDKLVVLLPDRVLVLNAALDLLSDTPLPQPLRDVIAREELYDANGYITQGFTGYDVSSDGTTYTYGTEDGLFLYHTATGISRQLYTSKTEPLLGDVPTVITLHNPRFCTGDTRVIASQTSYAAMGPLYSIDIATGGVTAWSEDPTLPIDPLYAGFGDYFGGILGGVGIHNVFPGANHYVALTYDEETDNYVLCCGLLNDPDPDHAKRIPTDQRTSTSSWGPVLAILSDGRILFVDTGVVYMSVSYTQMP